MIAGYILLFPEKVSALIKVDEAVFFIAVKQLGLMQWWNLTMIIESWHACLGAPHCSWPWVLVLALWDGWNSALLNEILVTGSVSSSSQRSMHASHTSIYIYSCINPLLSFYSRVSCSAHDEGKPWVDFCNSGNSSIIITIQTLNSVSWQRKINPLLATQHLFYLWQRINKISSEFAIAVIYHITVLWHLQFQSVSFVCLLISQFAWSVLG